MRKRSEVADVKPPAPEFVIKTDSVNEQVIIAASMVADEETRNRLLTRLQPEHFQIEEHRACWAAFIEMKNRKLVFDAATLQSMAGDRVRVAYVLEMSELRPEVPANLEYHVDALMWDRKRVTAAKGPLAALLESLRNPTEAPERVRALARSIAQAFEGHSEKQYIYDPQALVAEQMNAIRKRLQGHAVYPFGIMGLDYYEAGIDAQRVRRMVPGAAPGQVTMITGVTGSGKSTLTANITLGFKRQKRRVLFGAWEVLAPMTLEVLACIELGWSRTDLLDPEGAIKKGAPITPEMLVKLEETMHEIAKWVTFVKNPFRRNRGEKNSNASNLDIMQSIVADSGCSVFIADLWSRCLTSRKPDDEEEALFRYQAMIEEMNVHGIMVHQQRHKDVELRADKRPTREGIKGSGAYLEVADTTMGVHRPAQWKNIDDEHFEVFILKQRFGKWPIGIEFDWTPETGQIRGGRSIVYEQSRSSSFDDASGGFFKAPQHVGGGKRERKG